MKKYFFTLITALLAVSAMAQNQSLIQNLSVEPSQAIEIDVQTSADFQSYLVIPTGNVEIEDNQPRRHYYNQNYYFRFEMPENKDVNIQLDLPKSFKNLKAGLTAYEVNHGECTPRTSGMIHNSESSFKVLTKDFQAGEQVLIRVWFSENVLNARIGLSLSESEITSATKSITIDTSPTVTQLVNDVFLSGECETSNITLNNDTTSIGYFSGSISGTDFTEGLIMTTGLAEIAIGPDDGSSSGATNDGGSDPDLAAIIPGYSINDACIVEFDFVATDNYVSFDYIFASEEFPEFANTSFNDVFGFFLSGPGIEGPYTNGAINIALLPDGSPVTIDNLYNSGQAPEGYFLGSMENSGADGVAYNNDLEYDGGSIQLTAEANLWQGQVYHIKLAIGDAGDSAYDSGVLFGGSTFSTGNEARGLVFLDLNLDCVFDDTDIPLSGVTLNAEPGGYNAMTLPNGMYSMPLDLGVSNVSINLPPLFTVLCPETGTHELEITYEGQMIDGQNFALTPAIDCPLLNVDITGSELQACEQSEILVEFTNIGTILAEDVNVEITLDESISVLESGIPYTVENQTYSFEYGNLDIYENAEFTITLEVSCDAMYEGLTQCIEAEIFASNQCIFLNPGIPADTVADEEWDNSGISVTGDCVEDEQACFLITNTAEASFGDMQGNSEYRIYANDTLVYVGTFQLNGQESLEICWPTDGRAIRLEADQRPGHPGNSHPQYTVENCGDETGTSLGYIVTTPLDDYNFSYDLWCQEILPAGQTKNLNPIRLSVQPKGVSEYHYISNDAILNYTISFCNTEGETMEQIFVRNYLSESHDVSTLELTGSSHPADILVSKDGIITWTFNDINLLPEETSYVSFTIKQNPLTENDYGTEFNSYAMIHFSNKNKYPSNTTDLVFWEMPSNLVHIPESMNDVKISVYPNPANTEARFTLPQEEYTDLSFRLIDNQGKIIREMHNIKDSDFNVNLELMPAGIYFYDISNAGKSINKGKLIIE